MSRLLLDTTLLVDADRLGGSLDKMIADDDEVAIAAVTIAELLASVLLADTSTHRSSREQFVDEIRSTIPIIDYDATVAASHAQLFVAVRRQGRPRGAHDLIIAATANATQREVVSADLSAYQDLPGVRVRTNLS